MTIACIHLNQVIIIIIIQLEKHRQQRGNNKFKKWYKTQKTTEMMIEVYFSSDKSTQFKVHVVIMHSLPALVTYKSIMHYHVCVIKSVSIQT